MFGGLDFLVAVFFFFKFQTDKAFKLRLNTLHFKWHPFVLVYHETTPEKMKTGSSETPKAIFICSSSKFLQTARIKDQNKNKPEMVIWLEDKIFA